jgi:hypothetical protein
MPDERHYVVVAKNPRPKVAAGAETPPDTYTNLGNHAATTAEGACIAALEANGLPEKVTVAVAVPIGNWNACKVEEESRPRFTAKRMSAMPEKAEGEAEAGAGEPKE